MVWYGIYVVKVFFFYCCLFNHFLHNILVHQFSIYPQSKTYPRKAVAMAVKKIVISLNVTSNINIILNYARSLWKFICILFCIKSLTNWLLILEIIMLGKSNSFSLVFSCWIPKKKHQPHPTVAVLNTSYSIVNWKSTLKLGGCTATRGLQSAIQFPHF